MLKSASRSTSESAAALKIARILFFADPQLFFGALAFRDVVHDRQRMRFAAVLERHHVDVGDEGAAALVEPCQLGAAGLARERAPHELAARVIAPGAMRQDLEPAADHFLARVAENAFVRRVYVDAAVVAIPDHHRVGRSVEDCAVLLLRWPGGGLRQSCAR
jgi:hypothetical protein